MLLDTDIPYLEPLWLWLRKDPVLKLEFTEASFFMPHNDLITATQDAMNRDCPAPRALWILPQDTLAQASRDGCKSPGIHTFYIQIIVQCIRDPFQIVKRDGDIKLEGQFMELMDIRKKVKESVQAFAKDYSKTLVNRKFERVRWVKDSMLYPSQEDGPKFISTAIQFEVNIF